MAKKVVVIGSGFGGLASALALSTQGYDVTVVEAASQAGGKAGTHTVDGVSFDTGPSLLTLPEVLEQLFAMAGTTLDSRLTLRAPTPAFRYHYVDGTQLDIHHNREDTIASIQAELGSDAAREFDNFLTYAARIWNASAPHFVFGNAPSVRSLMSRDFRAILRLPAIDATSTMHSAITQRVSHPHLQKLLARYATYNGSDVRQCPATLNCIAHVELTLGGYGVEGGLGAVASALVDVCTQKGVNFRFNSKITSVQAHRKSVVGVVTSGGERIAADVIVSNAEAQHLFEDLLAGTRMGSKKTPAPSMSAYNAVYKATQNPDFPRTAHHVLFPDNYMDEFAAIFDRKTAPPQPTIYACDQQVAHGIDGWEGASPLFVMVNAPPISKSGKEPDSWPMLKDQMTQRLSNLGLIDGNDPVVWERTPRGLAHQFPGSRGSIYGGSSNAIWSAFRRPSNRVSGLKGLYMATGSAHPGGGVPLCLLSGIAAARAVIGDNKGNDKSLYVAAI